MKLFIIFFYFFKNEIIINLRRIRKSIYFFKTFSIFRLLLYLFNNSVVPYRDKTFRNYILKNSKKWKNKNNLKNYSNKKVLITNVFDHPGYAVTEIIIGKNLMEMFNADGIALLNEYNPKQILLFKSFGIKEIIILRNYNIIVRFKYFLKAYMIIKSCKNMDEFLNFNIKNVEIGKAVYDHYLRHSGKGTTNKFEPEFYVFLSKSLRIYDQIDKHFKKNKIIATVQSEVQFIPGIILLQHALVNEINVYSRVGTAVGKSNSFTVKKYSNYEDRHKSLDRFSKELYDLINKNIKKEAIEIGGEIIKRRFEGMIEYKKIAQVFEPTQFTNGKKITKIKKQDINKKDLCKKFDWNINSPIGVIFSPDLTDGVFLGSSWSLFRDNLTWLRETLIEIKKIHNVNWLVKSHPHDELRKVITSTVSEYEKICPNVNHIRMFPNNITMASIPKFIDVAITFNGSPASEYPCFGIPAIAPCESNCTGLGFTIDPRSKKEYFFQLQNVKKLKRLNNQQIELAKIFIFAQIKLTRIPSNLITTYSARLFDEENFWVEMTKLLDQYKYENDLLKKMMKLQQINNDLHTIDYRIIKKGNTLNRLWESLKNGQTESFLAV